MARPLRLEFPGAVYHITARGNAQQAIFDDDDDRQRFLHLLGREVLQQNWFCYAYCLMDNHYHLLLETPEANLSWGMRRLNGNYGQSYNLRHRQVGHLLQGRYKAILVERESHLMELCRYVVLNPVRASMATRVEKWPWSSYQATVGKVKSPDWLAVDSLLANFSQRKGTARNAYAKFVEEGIGKPSPWEKLRGQIYLGSEKFMEMMQERVDNEDLTNVSRAQRQPSRPEADAIIAAVSKAYSISEANVLQRNHKEAFNAAVYLLRRVGNLPLRRVAEMAGISTGRVSQIQASMQDKSLPTTLDKMLRLKD